MFVMFEEFYMFSEKNNTRTISEKYTQETHSNSTKH